METQVSGHGSGAPIRRALLERSRRGARLRRRVLAASALGIFFVGFAVTLGFGELLLIGGAGLFTVGAVAGAVLLLRGAPIRVGASRAEVGLRNAARLGRRGLRRGASVFPARIADWRGPARRLRQPALSRTRRRRQALSLNAEGAHHRRRGQYGAAVEKHGEALATLRELGDRPGEALTLNNLALALARHDDEAALAHFAEALAILRELADEQHEGQVVANLALVHRRRGREQQATDCLRAALEKLDPHSREYRRVEEQLQRAS
jgi:tetratricopeptide (TPR) repeat protein